MCVDSAVKPDDLQGPVGLWPCHRQMGNQVSVVWIIAFSFYYGEWTFATFYSRDAPR
jgi:hypothetical protein